MSLLALASLVALLSGKGAAPGAQLPCDDGRAVETVRAQIARDRIDVSTLQLVVEGPYARAKFVRTHPGFPPGDAVNRKLASRKFWFVWFHPPFRGSLGAKGSDVWALVDAARCDVLHLSRGR